MIANPKIAVMSTMAALSWSAISVIPKGAGQFPSWETWIPSLQTRSKIKLEASSNAIAPARLTAR